MNKVVVLHNIIACLASYLTLLTEAAKTAHAAATHAEYIPDKKYGTTGLEVLQGHAHSCRIHSPGPGALLGPGHALM